MNKKKEERKTEDEEEEDIEYEYEYEEVEEYDYESPSNITTGTTLPTVTDPPEPDDIRPSPTMPKEPEVRGLGGGGSSLYLFYTL